MVDEDYNGEDVGGDLAERDFLLKIQKELPKLNGSKSCCECHKRIVKGKRAIAINGMIFCGRMCVADRFMRTNNAKWYQV